MLQFVSGANFLQAGVNLDVEFIFGHHSAQSRHFFLQVDSSVFLRFQLQVTEKVFLQELRRRAAYQNDRLSLLYQPVWGFGGEKRR